MIFYEPGTGGHGLAHDPLKAIVAPRPIGWISTVSRAGINNLAPYSFFNMFSDGPWIVGFSSAGRKDSQANAEETGAFCCNLATRALAGPMNESSAVLPPDVDEFVRAGLTPVPALKVRAPRVLEAPAGLECVYLRTVPMTGRDGRGTHALVLGEIVGVHISEDAITDGRFDAGKVGTLARLGYRDYLAVDEIFEMARPRR